MTPFLMLLNSMAAATASAAPQEPASVPSASTEALAARAHETAMSGLFPLEVAFVVLGCLMVTGFVLMARESRIENKTSL